jgi:hypothetical protein
MNFPKTSRRRRLDLPAAVILGVLALVACFVAYEWWESQERERCISDLEHKGTMCGFEFTADLFATNWPFFDVDRYTKITLLSGRFDEEDVHRLRRAFPGVLLYKVDREPWTDSSGVGHAIEGELIPQELEPRPAFLKFVPFDVRD